MVRIVLSLFLLLMAYVGVCQNQPFYNQSKIIEVYGENWYEARRNEENSILLLLDKYIQFGFTVEEIIPEKYQDEKAIREIPLMGKGVEFKDVDDFLLDYEDVNFNPLKYGFFPSKEEQFYFLKNTTKIIRIKSLKYLNSL